MSDPYRRAYEPETQTWVREHRLILKRVLGYDPGRRVVVHHRDGYENAHENLVICPSQKYHALLHQRTEAFRETGDPTMRRCVYCAVWTHPESLSIGPTWAYHKTCAADYQLARRARRESESPRRVCACGCRTLIPAENYNGRPTRQYAHGHNRRHP